MDLALSKREKELGALGRRFCDEVLVPLELIVDEHGELPMERRAAVRQAVRDWGLAGINHGKELSGLGLTMLEQTVIEEQLGRVTNSLWSGVWRHWSAPSNKARRGWPFPRTLVGCFTLALIRAAATLC